MTFRKLFALLIPDPRWTQRHTKRGARQKPPPPVRLVYLLDEAGALWRFYDLPGEQPEKVASGVVSTEK